METDHQKQRHAERACSMGIPESVEYAFRE